MGVLGKINVKEFLDLTEGIVTGCVVTDGKSRMYYKEYRYKLLKDKKVAVFPADGTGNTVVLNECINLDEALIAFFGLYSGDGAKGTEDAKDSSIIRPSISLSQREPNLVRFAVEQFKRLFSDSISFNFSLGEDSAFFMDGLGYKMLEEYYGGKVPVTPALSAVRAVLNEKDYEYLAEVRPVEGSNEDHLAFYYFHKKAMEDILSEQKRREIIDSGIVLSEADTVTASLRRPFKKGARLPGGSSRSDEIYIRGLNGFGELFLKVLHEIEESIYRDTIRSTSGLIEWNDKPSLVGEVIDIQDFFENNEFASINGNRPTFEKRGANLYGLWPRSKKVKLKAEFRIDPLWCYVSGLYLAEGSTPKSELFKMYSQRPESLNFGFTSTENVSIELVIRSLKKLFTSEECVHSWKVKVGSQYFPELVVIGLKNGVPMLRSGNSGDGKTRTMEISLAIKNWALEVAPCLNEYAHKYSHVEPTGAGIARIDFSSSSSLCKWYFPLLMYAVFGQSYKRPCWR